MKCDLCEATARTVEEAISKDWVSGYFRGDEQCDPICPSCCGSLCIEGRDGELEFNPGRKKIREYLNGSDGAPSKLTISCLAGMIETGESTLRDVLDESDKHTAKRVYDAVDWGYIGCK